MDRIVLALKVATASEAKPPMWEPCNNCGWCCLTEVCIIGQELTNVGAKDIPCTLLVERDGGHYCSVADAVGDEIHKTMGIGTGCDAATQTEQLEKFNASSK